MRRCDAAIGVYMSRVRAYAMSGDGTARCVCGHPEGEHVIAPPHECAWGRKPRKTSAGPSGYYTRAHCGCERFTPIPRETKNA